MRSMNLGKYNYNFGVFFKFTHMISKNKEIIITIKGGHARLMENSLLSSHSSPLGEEHQT